MFEINLIKDRIVPVKQKHVIFGLVSLYILIWTLSIVAVLFLHVANVRMIGIYKGTLTRLESEISATYSGLPTSEELKIMWVRLLPDLTRIKQLVSRRILWASKLDRISRSLPEGVWIDEMRSEQVVPQKKGKHESASKKPPQQAFVLEGRARSVPDEEEITSVEHLVDSLKKDVLFMEGFESVELIYRERTAIGVGFLDAFQIRCRFDKGKGI